MEQNIEKPKCNCFTCRCDDLILKQAFTLGNIDILKGVIEDIKELGIQPSGICSKGISGALSDYIYTLEESKVYLQELEERSTIKIPDIQCKVLTAKQWDKIREVLAFYADYRNTDGHSELKFKTNDCRPDEYVSIGTKARDLLVELSK